MELRLHAALAAAEAREREREEEAGEGDGLRAAFRERAISFGTMDRRLRVVAALALLQIVVAAVFVGLRDVRMPTVALSTLDGEQTAIAAPIFWITVLSLSLAWAYALGGLLHGHRLVRVGALCLFTAVAYSLWDIPVPLATPRMVPSYILLAAVWAVGLHALRPTPDEHERRRLRLAPVPLLWLLGIGLYLAFWWRLRPFHDERVFTLSVYHQLQIAGFALIPVLLVAGVDFAEWGDMASERAAALLHRLPSAVWPAALAFAAAAAALAYRLEKVPLHEQARGVGLAALFVVLVLGLVAAARLRRPPAARVPYAVVFGSSVVLYGLLLGVSYLSVSSAQASTRETLRHAGAPRFAVEYPLGWTPAALKPEAGIQVFALNAPGNAAQVLVVAAPTGIAPLFVKSFHDRYMATAGAARPDGAWRVTDFRGGGKRGRLWQRNAEGDVWLVVGWTSPKEFPRFSSSFDEVAASWTTHASAAGTAPAETAPTPGKVSASDRAVVAGSLAWLVLAFAAAGVLTARRLPRPGWLVGGAVFVLAAGLLWVLVQLPTLAFVLFGSSKDSVPGLGLGDLQTFVAAATLAVLGWLALARPRLAHLRELLALLFVLNAGLLAVYWIDRGFAGGIATGGRFSLVQASLVLAALLWDVLMSGEAITNRHNRHFPRHTRVLVYLGYVMLVATAVLFFSSLRVQATNATIEPQFESEGYVEDGLLLLGTSLIVTLFVLRLSRARLRRPA